MIASKHLKSYFVILFLFVSHLAFSQLSKTHYIPPLTNAEFGNANPEDQYIYVSTPSGANVAYTITPVGQPASSKITGIVTNVSPQEVSLGTGNGQLFMTSNSTSLVTNDKGYIIEAEAPIYISIRMNAGGAQAGALVSKGLSALGTTFRVGSFTNENPQDNYLNFVSVMATEDNTQVDFSDLPAGLIIKNYSGTTPINVTLNKGESYTIATNCSDSVANQDGLIGCLVQSDKPIVVNCGSTNGSFGTGNGRDYGIDQIVDLSKVGTEYIFVRGDGDNAWENVLIVAHTDNTTISINGNTPITTINEGQYYVAEGNQYNAGGNMYVQTSQPVFAYQGVGGLGTNGSPSEANQGLFFVPPLSCESRGDLDNIANINNIGTTNYSGGISIVTKDGATVTINGAPISVGAIAVTGKSDYITYKIKGLNGNIAVQSSDELYCAYFNYNGSATSGSFYSGFPTVPEIIFDAEFDTLGNCIPNIILEAANTQNFDSFKWMFDDGSGFVDLMVVTPQIKPLIPGKYKLIGIITCTGEELESVEIPVSICPDDIDNDGIIDNIDIDNDNDGILNCTESKGDATINLSVLNSPELIFQDNTRDNTILTGNYTQSNTSGNSNSFTGNSSGGFTSIIGNGTNAENNYTISSIEPVNIKFEETISLPSNNIDGEYYIAKILPVSKNITLVDPDDHLLIDSNFDGIFESGITQISGSEIHFKVNPAPTGNIPYQFFGNQVDGFTFIHKLENATSSSIFTGGLSITCYKNDNDLDGITDALDLDSDNDGIPDFIENQGTLIPLSGIDIDNNGLDDAYDISATPIDNDNDGVLDYYDLDSDNDGIYDLIETGQYNISLFDSNLDGIEDGPDFGNNGWADAAETSPDSGLIVYTLNDLDGDTIFTYLDSDSDGDGCSDVIEAGFSDGNGNNYLGDNVVTVGHSGLVNNASDGYTLPNSDYLDVAPLTITLQPGDTVACEDSTGSFVVESPDAETFQWELSIDGINWTLITDDAIYSGALTNELLITNVPLTFNGNQYRVKLDRNGNTCGLYSDEIDLEIDVLPIANTALVMQQCDDDNNGTMPFDLTLQNSAINTTAGMTITYHATQIDADTGIAPLASPYESGNTTIFARVVNDINTGCYDSSSFDLEVFTSPFPLTTGNITPIQECDNTSRGTDTDGFIIFDLTQRETEILNGQSATEFSLTYFTDVGYSNEIATPTAFPNSVAGLQTIYVRVSNVLSSDCYTDTSFEIEVFVLPIVNSPNTYAQCDDESNDGQAFFNLTLNSIKEEINMDYLAEGFIFSYYKTQAEAESATNAITNPDMYQNALGFATETVWIRVENPNACFRIVPLYLEVNPSSAGLATYVPAPKYQCDDGTDNRDGIAIFDMTDIRDEITTTIFPTVSISVHFYESQADAELETNEIANISNHENTNSPNIQNIWVRVKSDLGNDCLGLQEFQNLLNVEALPVANPVTMQRQCDFDVSDAVLSYPFDTSQLETNVLNGQNAADVTITYFDTNGEALLYADGSTVTSPIESVFLSENQTITIRLTNNITQDPDGPCFDETTLTFVIDEQPVAYQVPPQIVCDGSAGDINDDGLFSFDTSTFASTILGSQSGMEIYFNYIDENGNPITDSTFLPNPLVTSSQIISVEVINPINTTCFAATDIELTVNPLPDFTVETPRIVCSSDPTFSIILDTQEASNIESFDYEWLWTSLDGSTSNEFVSSNSEIKVSDPGTYTVILTKTDGTSCSRSRDIFVDASELANITQDDVTIEDLSENNSVTIDPTNLGQGDYEYALRIEGSNFIVYQEEPFFDNVIPGFHTIFVRDKICGTASLDISVIGHAKFFTPNGDGFNDYWEIKGLNDSVQPNSVVLIFDRYGKLMKQLSVQSDGWDGTFNGSKMPTDDYWFRVMLEDGREFSGHFTLKR